MKQLRQSQLKDYEICDFLGYTNWGEIGSTGLCDEQEFTNKYAQTGIKFHEVCEYWGINKMNGVNIPISDLHILLDEKIDSIDETLFSDKEDLEKYRLSLHQQLDWMYDNALFEHITPIGVEVTFKDIELFEGVIPFTGTIDRISGSLEQKRIRLEDYKTGKTYTKKELSNNLQVTIYSLAFRKMFGFLPEEFVFYFSKTKKTKVVKVTPDFLKQGVERLLSIYLKIQNGEKTPNCTNRYFCRNFCNLFNQCPKYAKRKLGKSWDNVGG